MHKAFLIGCRRALLGARDSKSSILSAIVAGLVLGTFGTRGVASDAQVAAPEESGALAEVVVTARRQTESLEKVPVAIEAISQKELQERQIATETDLESAVPGLSVVEATSSNQLSFAIRGQALDAFSYTSPTVLTYFNEFQTSGTSASAFYDLESVQVLKGPQGTLFGRNATGGAVLYTSTPPSQEFGGYVNIGVGNYRDKKIEGAVTLPANDVLSFRIAAQSEKRDGFEHNLYLNLYEDSVDSKNVRLSMLFKPTDKLTSSTVYQFGKYGGYSGALKIQNAYACGTVNNGYTLACTSAALYPPNNPAQIRFPQLAQFGGLPGLFALQNKSPFWNVWNDTTSSHDAEQGEMVNKTTYQLTDDVAIKNIIGYNKLNSRDQTDVDGSPFQILTIGLTGGPSAEGYNYRTEQYSDELQLAGTLDEKKLNYIFGAYYSRDFEAEDIPLNVGADYPGGTVEPTGAFRYNFETQDESRALFFQTTYEILEGFHFTAGYRETWERVDIVQVQDSVPNDLYAILGVPPAELSETKPSWTLGLDYQLTPEAMVYVAQRGSFREGGFNGTSTVPNPNGTGAIYDQFKPETSTDVEVGAKFSGKIATLPARLNIAVYDQQIRDVQRAVYLGIAAETSNARKARVDGVEMDALIDLTAWLQWGANFAYTNARYTDGTASAVNAVTGVLTPLVLGPYGDTPKETGSVYVRVTHQLPSDLGELALRGDIYSQSTFYYTNLANTLTPGTGIPGYSLMNARLDWNQIAGSKFHASAYVHNIANKEYETGGLGLGGVIGSNAVDLGTPRMYGVELGVRF
jgi:iron complex outermembrane receptor protein